MVKIASSSSKVKARNFRVPLRLCRWLQWAREQGVPMAERDFLAAALLYDVALSASARVPAPASVWAAAVGERGLRRGLERELNETAGWLNTLLYAQDTEQVRDEVVSFDSPSPAPWNPAIRIVRQGRHLGITGGRPLAVLPGKSGEGKPTPRWYAALPCTRAQALERATRVPGISRRRVLTTAFAVEAYTVSMSHVPAVCDVAWMMGATRGGHIPKNCREREVLYAMLACSAVVRVGAGLALVPAFWRRELTVITGGGEECSKRGTFHLIQGGVA